MARKKKVKTANKKKVTIDELNAYRSAYGEELGRKDYFTYVIVPGFLFAFFGTILLYNVWLSIAMFVFGCIYGWSFFLPKSIKKNYEKASFDQRNKFINNLTQVLTDQSKTVLVALGSVASRADGEFKDDLMRMQAGLFGSDRDSVTEAFNEMTDKYKDDVIFVQYMEQVETATLEGNTNIDTLKDIKAYHNEMKVKQEQYEKKKNANVGDMKVMAFTITAFILALTFSFGFDMYLTAFARSWVGYVTCAIYLLIIGMFFKQFSTYLFDDSITSISK